MNEYELYHYGVKGMKWGVRKKRYGDVNLDRKRKLGQRVGDMDNVTIKKGTKVYRVSYDKNDKTFDNKKYVSLRQDDNSRWEKEIGGQMAARGVKTYNVQYKTSKDVKLASAKKVGQVYNDMLKDEKFRNQAAYDNIDAFGWYGENTYGHPVLNDRVKASVNIAFQTQTGKAIVDRLKKEGYGAIGDQHGRNTAKDPIIILDPDKGLVKEGKTERTKYSRQLR